MKVTLTKENIWYLLPTMGEYTYKQIYYKDDTPSYIIDYLKKQPYVKLYKGDVVREKDDVYVEYDRALQSRWPTEDELKKTNISVFIDCKNFNNAFFTFSGQSLISNDKELTDFKNIQQVTELPFNTMIPKDSETPYNKKSIKNDNIYILHFLKLFSSEEKLQTVNYRRFKLRNFLSKKYGEKYKSIINFNNFIAGYYPIIVISTSIGHEAITENCTYDLLVYDRTDNWGALSEDNKIEEDSLIEKADIVFNSSQFLYEDSVSKRGNEKQTYFIPNGCDVKEYKPIEKYNDTTAVYIGKGNNGKVDWDKIKKISKDYKVLIYGDFNQVPDLGNNVEYKGYLDEDSLHTELCKCHVGLIPFLEGDWTRGMLPLKLFHYCNAHIPTLYWNCPECDKYKSVASSTEILSPTYEDYEQVLATADWSAKFDTMNEIIKKNMEKKNED